MANSNKEVNNYESLGKIGQGSFGVIRKVKRKSDGMVLCRKEIQYLRMSQKEREQLQAEFSILSSLRHPNIVAYYHRDHLKTEQELHLYMEFCGGGDLSKVIKSLKDGGSYAGEDFVWSILTQLTTALYRCHYGENAPEVGSNIMEPPVQRGKPGLRKKNQVMILHRDLKPENVFLGQDNEVKLGDFGLSKLMQSHDFASTFVGTPFYMPPEVCASERYTLHADIWSLGCIIYELCQREPPFNAKTHFLLCQKIKEGRFAPLPNMYSPELKKVVAECLNVNPLHRPDTWDLLQLPVVRLLRKEKEVVELGQVLKIRNEEIQRKAKEADAVLNNLNQRKELAHAEIEATVRREWEVKARLEIDRQVAMEKERLQKLMEDEVQTRIRAEAERLYREHKERESVSRRTSKGRNHEATSPTSQPVPGLSSISTATDSEGPLTDISNLSIDTPATSNTGLVLPMKRSRTPFSRARTQIDSPMDVAMASPSPMSIASLSLSPRRAAALCQGIPTNTNNIFLAAKARQRWQPQLMSPVSSDEEDDGAHSPDDEDYDSVHVLPSPTRMPRAVADPFKNPARPGLTRQNTAPSNRQQAPRAALFTGDKGSPTSPTRKRRGPTRPGLTKASTTMGGVVGGENTDMFRAVVAKNMNTVNNNQNGNLGLGGRTLVELQQARAGGRPPNPEPAIWDPEKEEMPSPFVTRVKYGIAHLPR